MLTRTLVAASFAGHLIVLTVIGVVQALAMGPLPQPRHPLDPFVVHLVRLGDIELPPMPRAEARPPGRADASSAPVVRTASPTVAAPLEPQTGIRPETDLDRAFGARGIGGGEPAIRSLGSLGQSLGGPVALPEAPPRPAGPVRLHQGIAPPVPISMPTPIYPAIARTARVDGIVILDVVIDETGRVTGAKVLRSIPLLDKAAIDAITSWRYEPARLNGIPIAISMTVTVRFTLNGR